MPLSSAIFSFFPSYTIFLPPETLFLPFYPQLNYFFCTLDALNINPQKKNSQEESVLRASRSSRSSRGKILKRKVSQEPQEERSSRVKILKRKYPQEERSSRSSRFSRFSGSSGGKVLKRILKSSFVVLQYTCMLQAFLPTC